MPKFSKKARRHAAQSRARTQRMVKDAARRSGPVTISYLPGFGPPATKYPFKATINGRPAIVYPDRIEYPDRKEQHG